MKQLILICLFGFVAFAHAQLEKKWDKGGPCVFNSGNCGFGKRIQTCSNCFTPTTREVKCYLLCLKESTEIEKKRSIERDADESEFNSWGSWSECTSSCGLGEQMQTRVCKAGTGNCTGDSIKTQSCTPVGECVMESCDGVPNGPNDENFEECNKNSRRCGNWRMMHAEWKIGSGQTKTKGTGPINDNTFKKDCGKYAYFDLRATSSTYKELRMISPVSTTATSCLSFSLSMFSIRPSAMGNLIVKILGSKDTLFNREGGLGSRKQGWEPVKINIPKGSNFLIVFAAKAKGWEADIAIDDIIFTENEKCKEGVDGNWAKWEQWSDCDQSCGTGQKSRMRTCTSPPPTNDGLPCIGHSEEKKLCIDLKPCPVNGKWSKWGPYSACEQTCGDEYQIRTRECEDRVGDGLKCLLKNTDDQYALSQYQSRKCNLPDCMVDIKTPGGESQSLSSCPDGWIAFRVDRGTDSELNCYKFSDAIVTYNQAKAACNNAKPTKAYLTSILTAEEQAFLIAKANGDFFNGAIGTSRNGANRWSDEKAFLYSNVPSGQDLDCAYTDKITGEWNIHACDSGDLKHYVCKSSADLWNPWSAFSKCSGSYAEGIKTRSRTCAFPREGYPFECIPLDRQNTVKKNGITSEFETLPCTNTAAPECLTTTNTPVSSKTTTTPATMQTYSWLEWSDEIDVDGRLVKVRACDGANANVTCEDDGQVNILESDEKFVQMKIVNASCGEEWEKMVSRKGETTCWHYSSDETMNYEAAKAYCSDMGGQIASIVSSEEQNFVMQMLPTYQNGSLPSYCVDGGNCSYWIGAVNDSSANLGWSWEDGTLMGYSYFHYQYEFDRPESTQGLVLDQTKAYSWLNHARSEIRQALCKKIIFKKWECPENWYRIGDACFLAENDALSFDKAASKCEEYGGTLASITNIDEQVFIQHWLLVDYESITEVYIGGVFVTAGVPENNTNNVTVLWLDGTYWTPFGYFGLDGDHGAYHRNKFFESNEDVEAGDCLITTGTDIDNVWSNKACTEELPFVCKISLVPEPECEEGWYRLITPNGIQCYYIAQGFTTETELDAFDHISEHCQSRGAHLAKLDEDFERSFAIDIAKKSGLTGSPFGIGLWSEVGEYLFWSDQQEEDLSTFLEPGTELDGTYSTLCGYIKEDFSGFEFSRCGNMQVFICQREYFN